MRNICESPSWVLYEKYLGNMLEIFMGAQNSLWACTGILLSGPMKLGPEKLYLNRPLTYRPIEPNYQKMGCAWVKTFDWLASKYLIILLWTHLP